MARGPFIEQGKLPTVCDVLYAYSGGNITEAEAIDLLHLDNADELREAMCENEISMLASASRSSLVPNRWLPTLRQ